MEKRNIIFISIACFLGLIIAALSVYVLTNSHSNEVKNSVHTEVINDMTQTSKEFSKILNSGKKKVGLRDSIENLKDKIDSDTYKEQFNLNDEYVASRYEYTASLNSYNYETMYVETLGEQDITNVVVISTVTNTYAGVYDESEKGSNEPIGDSDALSVDFVASIDAPYFLTEVFSFSNKTGKLTNYIRYSGN